MSIARHLLAATAALTLIVPTIARAADDITTSIAVKRIVVRAPADARKQTRLVSDAALSVCGARDGDLPDVRSAIRHSACYADALTTAKLSGASASAAPLATGGRP